MSEVRGRGSWSVSARSFTSQKEFSGVVKEMPENRHIVDDLYQLFPQTVFGTHDEMVNHLKREPINLLPVNRDEFRFDKEGLPVIYGDRREAYATFLADACKTLDYPVQNLKVFPASEWTAHLKYLLERLDKPLVIQERNNKLFSLSKSNITTMGIEGGNGCEMVESTGDQWKTAVGNDPRFCGKAYYDETGIHFSLIDDDREYIPLIGNKNEMFTAGMTFHMSTRIKNIGRIVALIKQGACDNTAIFPLTVKERHVSGTFVGLMQHMNGHVGRMANYVGFVQEQLAILNSLQLTEKSVDMLINSGPFSSFDKAVLETDMSGMARLSKTGLDAFTQLTEHSTHRITTDPARQLLAQRYCGELLNPKCDARKAMALIKAPSLITDRDDVRGS